MRHDHDGAVFACEPGDRLDELILREFVEPTGRLVEQEDGTLGKEREADAHSLLLAAGQVARRPREAVQASALLLQAHALGAGTEE